MASQMPAWVRELDFFGDPSVNNDPYPLYDRLRKQCPVAHSDASRGYWLISRYGDVHSIFTDAARFSNQYGDPNGVRSDLGPSLLIESDHPEHWAFRQLVAPSFTPKKTKEFEPLARTTARRLLHSIADRRQCEFLQDFAIPFPAAVTLPMMGVHPEKAQELVNLAWDEEQRHHAAITDPGQRLQVMRRTRARQVECFRQIFEERERTGGLGDDLISTMVAAKIDGKRRMTEREMLNLALVIYNAALHTTTNTLMNMVWFLSQHPAHRDRLVQQPSQIGRAVEGIDAVRVDRRPTAGRSRRCRDRGADDQERRQGAPAVRLGGAGSRAIREP